MCHTCDALDVEGKEDAAPRRCVSSQHKGWLEGCWLNGMGRLRPGGWHARTRERWHRRWVSAVQDALSLLVLVLSPSSCATLSLMSKYFPPGSCTKLHLLMSTSPGSNVWLWLWPLLWLLLSAAPGLLVLLLLVASASAVRAVRAMLMVASGLRVSALVFSTMSVPSLSSRTGLPSMLLSGFLWMLQCIRACSNFVVGFASPFLVLEISACSFHSAAIANRFGFGGFGYI